MFKLVFLAAAFLAAPVSVSASHVILSPAAVIGSSGSYTACCNFNPGSIFDQQTGPVTETFGSGYWLNADNGPAAAYITVDLGKTLNLSQVILYNTANGLYGDRGTGNFSIFGSNGVSAGQLVAPTLVASGTLTAGVPYTGSGPSFPVAQSFAASGNFRYISFNPTSVASTNAACCGANVYGLNELKVVGSAVPEPESWALLLTGFAFVGASMRRKVLRAA